MSGHSKWSSIKHKKGAADKKRGVTLLEALAGADRRGARGRRRSGQQPRAAERDREGEELLDAEGQHRARDRARLGRRRRRERVRDRRVRGLRRRRRRDPRRGADGQPQPHRVRCALRVLEARRQPRRVGRGRVAVRPARHRARRRRGSRRGRADARGGGRRRRRRRARRLDVPDHGFAGVALGRARGGRGCGLHRRERRADDGAEDDGRDRRGEHGEEDPAPDRLARGERRRAGRLLELRHPERVLETVAG